MNTTNRLTAGLAETLWERLNGKTVLVNSVQDHGNPQTGMRGWIEVRPARQQDGSRPEVQIALEFPQMFTARAHHRTVSLTDEQVAQLLASERNGTFSIALSERLDPDAPPGNE